MRSVVFAVLLLGGCASKDAYDAVLEDLEALSARMCACTDKACADKVQDDARAYKLTIADRIGRENKDKPSDAQERRGRAADEQMRACRKKLEGTTPLQ